MYIPNTNSFTGSKTALIKKHQAKMAWSMAGWHGSAALYHPQGCKKCDDYVAHAVEASNLNQLNVLHKDIDHALKVAWPGIIHDIKDDAISDIREDFNNLQYDFNQLQKQLDEAQQELNLEKGRSAHLKSELKRYQSSRSDTHSHSMSNSLLTTTPPTVLSSCTMLDQTPVVSSSQMTLDKTTKKSFGKSRMLGSDEMIDLDTLPESQAASIAAIGGPVNQQLLDVTAPIEDGEAFIQYLHEEALENTQEADVMRRDGDRERTEVSEVRRGLDFSLCAAPLDAYYPQISGMCSEVRTMSSRDNQCQFQTGEHT